jgi:hypothetical protein
MMEIHNDIKFIFVYIAEAHADDTWPMGLGINTWKTKDEVMERAKLMKEKYPIFDWYCDFNNDLFNNFHVWPERIMIINNSVIEYDSPPPECHTFSWISNL